MEENGDTEDDREARALLNKFLGASVLMSGVESMMPQQGVTHKETIVSSSRPSSSHKVSRGEGEGSSNILGISSSRTQT